MFKHPLRESPLATSARSAAITRSPFGRVNTLAVYTVVQFYEGLPPMRRRQLVNTPRLGQMDVYLEGLNKADILAPAGTK